MIKASDVLETVRQLGKEHPDETRECRYVRDDGTPCCIVGTALIENGFDPQIFLDSEDLNRFTNVTELFNWERENLGLENDVPEAVLYGLQRTQKVQDDGDSWGEAIKELR